MSVRYDWYQSDTKVVITVMLKNATEKNYKVNINKDSVEMIADNYELNIPLYLSILPEQSSHKATPSKVEISLAKTTGERWQTLERKIILDDTAAAAEVTRNKEIDIETARSKKPNWDKIANEITAADKDEEASDEKLNSLFQQIYKDANEETRRAMNKSFSESGGTVLSTNWQEVGQKKVEVKPPDGTEFKQWN